MGNGICKITVCFTGDGRRKDTSVVISDPVDDLGHSFCYVRPDPTRISSSKVHSEEAHHPTATATATTTFKSISGAAVSANTTTPPLTAFDPYVGLEQASSAFESSTSFSSIPLQPIPRSGPLIPGSGPMSGFLSGPIERGFMSGPLDQSRESLFSGPIGPGTSGQFRRSYSHNFSKKSAILRVLRRAISKTMTRGNIQNSIVAPIKGALSLKEQDWVITNNSEKQNELTVSSEGSLDDGSSTESQNLQWAQGKAGEDRVHVVVSEEHGWVFVGIYDGFNGPDAPDYLLSNLYSFVFKELKGVLWDDKLESSSNSGSSVLSENPNLDAEFSCQRVDDEVSSDRVIDGFSRCIEEVNYPVSNANCELSSRKKRCKGSRSRGAAKKWEENQRRWKCEFDRERLELDRRLKEQLNSSGSRLGSVNHSDVLKALSQGLRKTEEAYLDVADKMLDKNPELALMGSCVLVMLMKGEDVYVMNVGDSRAVLAQKSEPDVWKKDLERIKEETMLDLEGFDDDDGDNVMPSLCASQLTMDHSTSVDEEVQRIKGEHSDDACAVMNDRVKGSLKVTRAFGAGFLKQPKWNDVLLEVFRIDYVGTSPYITCSPFLHHHKLGPRDRFLILSSDGLYQYFTNEEAVSEVELFIALWPEGDPAQHLVEEVLFRAAKKAGLDFHELLEIPQGDRRRYHDDVSIIVISLEGRIWRSCV